MAVSRLDDLAGDTKHEDCNNFTLSMNVSPSDLFNLKLNSYQATTQSEINNLDVCLDDPSFVNNLPSTLSVLKYLKSMDYTGLVFFVESITKIE
jgi:hypothetical protein